MTQLDRKLQIYDITSVIDSNMKSRVVRLLKRLSLLKVVKFNQYTFFSDKDVYLFGYSHDIKKISISEKMYTSKLFYTLSGDEIFSLLKYTFKKTYNIDIEYIRYVKDFYRV